MSSKDKSVEYLLGIKPLDDETKQLLGWKTRTTGQRQRVPISMVQKANRNGMHKSKNEKELVEA